MDHCVLRRRSDEHCYYQQPCAVGLDYIQHYRYRHLVRLISKNDQVSLDLDQTNWNTMLCELREKNKQINKITKFAELRMNFRSNSR